MKNKEFQKLFSTNAYEPSSSLKEKIMLSADGVEVEPKYIQTKVHSWIKQVAVAFCIMIVLVGCSLSGIGLFNENYIQVEVEVNPAIVLNVNRFDVINSVKYKNEDAQNCFGDLALKGKDTKTALSLITKRLDEKGYLTQEGQMFINCFSSKTDVSNELTQLHNIAKGEVNALCYSMQVLKGVNKADLEQMAGQAYELGVYLTKYLLIEMICQNTSYTQEQIKGYSLTELLGVISQNGLGEKLQEISNKWDLNLYVKAVCN